MLRLAIALDSDRQAIAEIFRFIWREGRDVADANAIKELATRLKVANVAESLSDDAVKAELRANTEEAAERGVFGVPTSAVDDRLFWGLDATEMLLAYLNDPSIFGGGEYQRVSELPIGASRK